MEGDDERELERDGARSVEQYIRQAAGAIGQKALVDLVRARGDQRRSHGENVAELLVLKRVRDVALECARRRLVGKERKGSIRREVARLPDQVVKMAPVVVYRRSEDRLEDVLQRS